MEPTLRAFKEKFDIELDEKNGKIEAMIAELRDKDQVILESQKKFDANVKEMEKLKQQIVEVTTEKKSLTERVCVFLCMCQSGVYLHRAQQGMFPPSPNLQKVLFTRQ